MNVFRALAICLGLVIAGYAAQPELDFAADEDVQVLCKARAFDLGGNMFGVTKTETALRNILKRDDYVRPLSLAYNQGTPATKVYVLAAFHEFAPSLFALCKSDLAGKYNPMVPAWSGCLSSDGTLLEFLIRIQSGQYSYYIREIRG